LLFLGDVHASQADSELTGVANETAADVTLSCHVIKERRTPGICRIEKPQSLVQVDGARNSGGMDRALTNCFRNMIRWLVDDYGMNKREAYLQMSATRSFASTCINIQAECSRAESNSPRDASETKVLEKHLAKIRRRTAAKAQMAI